MDKMSLRGLTHPFYVNEKVVRTFTSVMTVPNSKGLDLLPFLNRVQRVSGSTVVTAANHVAPFVKSAKPYEAVMIDITTFEIDNGKLTNDSIVYTVLLNNTNVTDEANRLLTLNGEELELLQHVCGRVVS